MFSSFLSAHIEKSSSLLCYVFRNECIQLVDSELFPGFHEFGFIDFALDDHLTGVLYICDRCFRSNCVCSVDIAHRDRQVHGVG